MDHAQEAKRHRRMAEEMRARGEPMANEAIRAQYFLVADIYDVLAETEEHLAGNLKIRPAKVRLPQ